MEEMLEDIDRLMGDLHGALEALRQIEGGDVYEPQGAFSKNATTFFYKKLGIEPPSF